MAGRVNKDHDSFTDLISAVRETLHDALDLEKSYDNCLAEREAMNERLMLALDDVVLVQAELIELYRVITEIQALISPHYVNLYSREYGGNMVKTAMEQERLTQERDTESVQTHWNALSQDDRDLYVEGSAATIRRFVDVISKFISETIEKGTEKYVNNEYTETETE